MFRGPARRVTARNPGAIERHDLRATVLIAHDATASGPGNPHVTGNQGNVGSYKRDRKRHCVLVLESGSGVAVAFDVRLPAGRATRVRNTARTSGASESSRTRSLCLQRCPAFESQQQHWSLSTT